MFCKNTALPFAVALMAASLSAQGQPRGLTPTVSQTSHVLQFDWRSLS